jgi:polygalacturonase
MTTHAVTHFGAVGDGAIRDTIALQAAIDAAAAHGGTVLVPAGLRCLTGTLTLRSGVTLHLEAGAVLLGSADAADYTHARFGCLLEADGCTDVALTGAGVIDGQSALHIVEEGRYIHKARPWRPRLLGFARCRRVTVRDITVRNSACWGLHLSGCDDVDIHGIRILNDLRMPNCDGIDPDHCRNVRISHCYIEAGDDGIVLKNTREFADCGPTEDILITDCVLQSTSAAIKIGSESVDDFRRIVVANCVVRRSSRGVAIQLRDQGNVEDVLVSNLVIDTRLFSPEWWGRAEPIYLTARHRSEVASPWNPDNRLGRVRRVRLHNIVCQGENGVVIVGSPDSPLEDVVLDGVDVRIAKTSKWPGGLLDLRPCAHPDPTWSCPPDDDPGLVPQDTYGVYAAHVHGLTLRHTRVQWEAPCSDALRTEDVTDLDTTTFNGEAAPRSR